MSYFAGDTPVLELVVRNRFAGTAFPASGSLPSVVDTGYDGFLAVPPGVFRSLKLDQGAQATRERATADGRRVQLKTAPGLGSGIRDVPWLGRPRRHGGGDRGGARGDPFLSAFRLDLDYRLGRARLTGRR